MMDTDRPLAPLLCSEGHGSCAWAVAQRQARGRDDGDPKSYGMLKHLGCSCPLLFTTSSPGNTCHLRSPQLGVMPGLKVGCCCCVVTPLAANSRQYQNGLMRRWSRVRPDFLRRPCHRLPLWGCLRRCPYLPLPCHPHPWHSCRRPPSRDSSRDSSRDRPPSTRWCSSRRCH